MIGSPHWTISDPGSSERRHESACSWRVRQGFRSQHSEAHNLGSLSRGRLPRRSEASATASGRPALVLVYFLYLLRFEFDPAKSAANLQKRGIDFVAAQALWSDPDRLEIPAHSSDEPRTQVIGRIGDLVWSAFVTRRGERIRIISVRRARDEEKAAYLQD